MEAEVASVVRRASIRSGQVVVIADTPLVQLIAADVTFGGGREDIGVGGRHNHRQRAIDGGVDRRLFRLQSGEEVVDDVGSAVHHRGRRVAGVVADYVVAVPRWCMLLEVSVLHDTEVSIGSV